MPLLNAQFYWRQSSSFFPCTWTLNFPSYVNLNLPKVQLSRPLTWLAYNVKNDSRYRVFRKESAVIRENFFFIFNYIDITRETDIRS